MTRKPRPRTARAEKAAGTSDDDASTDAYVNQLLDDALAPLRGLSRNDREFIRRELRDRLLQDPHLASLLRRAKKRRRPH